MTENLQIIETGEENRMKNKKWKEFDRLNEKCYTSLAGMGEDHTCWDKAYEALKKVIADERSGQPDFGAELYLLDEATDYSYDVQGWLEDYLDDLDMREEKGKLLEVCDELLNLFCWEEDKPSDIKFLKASALGALGRQGEALELCKEWLAQEPDNFVAVTANVYALLASRDMEEAEKLIKQHIQEDTKCTDENDILFTAAIAYYKAAGNKKEVKRLEKASKEYEKQAEKLFMGFDEEGDIEFLWDEEDEDSDFGWDEDELPFS